MPVAISYVRFSSIKQIDSSSRERQNRLVAGWLEANPDYTLSELKFEDLGRSGYHGDHVAKGGSWGKLLVAVEEGVIEEGSVILVEAIDRTGRLDMTDALHYLTPILRAGISIITLDDGNTYNRESLNGSQIFLLVAKIQAAHSYSKLLSERTKQSYQIRREKAKNGEQVKRLTPIWLTTDGKIKDHLAPSIREAFDLYISGMGKNSIANRLRASGIEEFKTCSGPTIDAWLTNKTAIGYWGDIPNAYPAVVTKEVFFQAQKRRREIATKKPEKTSKHLLVGLVKCGVCGGNYIIQHKDGHPYNMRCLTRQRLKDNGCTNTKTIPINVLEFIRRCTSLHSFREAFEKRQLTNNEKRKIAIESEIEAITSQIEKMVALAAALDDIAEVAAKIKELNKKREALNTEFILLERTVEATDENEQLLELTWEQGALRSNDPTRLNSILKSVNYNITVYPDGIIRATNEVSPFKYLGPKRLGNATAGYRVIGRGYLELIAPQWLHNGINEREPAELGLDENPERKQIYEEWPNYHLGGKSFTNHKNREEYNPATGEWFTPPLYCLIDESEQPTPYWISYLLGAIPNSATPTT